MRSAKLYADMGGGARDLTLRSMAEDTFVASFDGNRDRHRILEGGPWVVGKHCVVLEVLNI